MPVTVFEDPNPAMLRGNEDLFRDFGLEAYTMIYMMEENERQRDEDEAWDRKKPLREDEPEEEEWLDWGDE